MYHSEKLNFVIIQMDLAFPSILKKLTANAAYFKSHKHLRAQ